MLQLVCCTVCLEVYINWYASLPKWKDNEKNIQFLFKLLCTSHTKITFSHASHCLAAPVACSIFAATTLALREWMTVIDAAIQGVPEQAKRRLRTVTTHFSVRRGKKVEDGLELPRSYSAASLDERGLDLVTASVSLEGADGASNGRVDAE